jgi:ubiquitin conjugation factor E4 B
LKKLERKIELMMQDQLTTEAHINDPQTLAQAAQYYVFTAAWLLKLADPEGKGLPLKSEPDSEWACLPEFIFEDLAQYFTYAMRHSDLLYTLPLDVLMTFLVTFISSPAYLKNPYLRATLVEVSFLFLFLLSV